jgi:hypothetical protein
MHGCNYGTGTDEDISLDDIYYTMNERKKQFVKQNFEDTLSNPLFKMFDKKIKLKDFNKRYIATPVKEINRNTIEYQEQIEEIYKSLGKITDKQKKHNCNACGRGSCKSFAESVIDGYAIINSCFFHSQKILHDLLDSHY